jgi:hypothetical protein
MEIGPVSGVRIAPAARPKESLLGLTDVYEVERSSRTGDETYSPGGAKAATGFEDDENKAEDKEEYKEEYDEPEDAPCEELEDIELEDAPDATPKAQADRDSQVDYFA